MALNNKQQINSYLSFYIGDELYAAHISTVMSILEMMRLTHLPDMPHYMAGIINLRGEVLPVVDTRIKFGLPATEVTPRTCIMVLQVSVDGEPMRMGALVDGVHEVFELNQADVLPPPKMGKRYKSPFITGMRELNDQQFIMILDMDKVFSSDEIVMLRDAGEVGELMTSSEGDFGM